MWSVCLSIYVVYNSTYIVLTLSLLKNRECQFLPSSLLNETAVIYIYVDSAHVRQEITTIPLYAGKR